MNRSSPVSISLPAELTPDMTLDALSHLPGRVLLETGRGVGRTLVSAAPCVELRWSEGEVEVRGGRAPGAGVAPPSRELPDSATPAGSGPGAWRGLPGVRDPFSVLSRGLDGGSRTRAVPEGRPAGADGSAASPSPRPLDPSSFRGGWIGYLGYEVGDLLETLPPPPPREEGDLSTVWFGAYDWAVLWEGAGPPRLVGGPLPRAVRNLVDWGVAEQPGSETLEEGMAALVRHLTRVAAGHREPERPLSGARDPSGAGERASAWPHASGLGAAAMEACSSLGRTGYMAGVETIRRYIRAGDIYQANLTHRIQRPWSGGGLQLYRRLRDRSPAPYGAYLDTGEGEVASISPEAFLLRRGDRVETRPIKGTAPRGASPEEDRERAAALEASAKDRAENVMIVDLLRNDLSRVSRPGSVRVPHLLALESHPSVHHLVSTVVGTLRSDVDTADLLRATLPGGSITGAPKIRAMEILRELEPVRRGAYTGALGILGWSGDLELSIAIRTAQVVRGIASFGVGGGITLDSEAEAEWQESLDKARPFLDVTGEGRP